MTDHVDENIPSEDTFVAATMDDEEAFGRGFSVGRLPFPSLYPWMTNWNCLVQQTFGIELDFVGQSLTVHPLPPPCEKKLTFVCRDGQS